jgi:DNA helicase IV
MDKRVIFAVAGSGKTTYIVDNLNYEKRSLVITYTIANYNNLRRKITEKFDGKWPENITLMTYFSFLYRFCYKPFLSYKCKAKGLLLNHEIVQEEQDRKRKQGVKMDKSEFYMTTGRYFYYNRLALLLQKCCLEDINKRIETYFDEFIIDEVQDIAGRDFTFLECLMSADVGMLFVGDFYQHTFDTSRDGNANSTLFDNKERYKAKFENKGFIVDDTTLISSWRCGTRICEYISANLGIAISSCNSNGNVSIEHIADDCLAQSIIDDGEIIKLHYRNGHKSGAGHRNWGDTKGEDCYQDVCVMLNKTTAEKRRTGKLHNLPPQAKNKLYVAITRAHGNVYLVDE